MTLTWRRQGFMRGRTPALRHGVLLAGTLGLVAGAVGLAPAAGGAQSASDRSGRSYRQDGYRARGRLLDGPDAAHVRLRSHG